MITKIKNKINKHFKTNHTHIYNGYENNYEKFVESANLNIAKEYYNKATNIYKYRKIQKLFHCFMCHIPKDSNFENCIEYLYLSADIYKYKQKNYKESKNYQNLILYNGVFN